MLFLFKCVVRALTQASFNCFRIMYLSCFNDGSDDLTVATLCILRFRKICSLHSFRMKSIARVFHDPNSWFLSVCASRTIKRNFYAISDTVLFAWNVDFCVVNFKHSRVVKKTVAVKMFFEMWLAGTMENVTGTCSFCYHTFDQSNDFKSLYF